ncbi:SDR family oxidoreductase [bacterium]|nr:SDR family oxidoreductase [bacterium]
MESTVLITGAAQRLGRHIALHLAEKGHNIALHYHRSEDAALRTATEIRKYGVRCTLFQCDLADRHSIKDFISNVASACPDLDILINNASIFERAHLSETSDDLLDRLWEINFRTPYIFIRDFARSVKNGNIINMLDTKVTQNHTAYCAYSITKKALLDLTKLAAAELGPGIRVNGIGPGLILPSADLSDADFQRMSMKIPLKRVGDPDNIARAVDFFLDHNYVTGEYLLIDGGEHLI